VETHRRGTETAKTVGAASDGAGWTPGFVDFHRPDARRILAFPQAVESVAHTGQAGAGEAGLCLVSARGSPIGGGRVARANKQVVARRLKGTGRPWARRPLNPMGALRAMACSDRWQEAWPQMAQQRRHQVRHSGRQRQLARRPAQALAVLIPRRLCSQRCAAMPHKRATIELRTSLNVSSCVAIHCHTKETTDRESSPSASIVPHSTAVKRLPS
jgi:hypothetical protein